MKVLENTFANFQHCEYLRMNGADDDYIGDTDDDDDDDGGAEVKLWDSRRLSSATS